MDVFYYCWHEPSDGGEILKTVSETEKIGGVVFWKGFVFFCKATQRQNFDVCKFICLFICKESRVRFKAQSLNSVGVFPLT